jgi:predicted regulator of Ras-like GTPase activity (Roadblock/LC7/MglB family)
MSADLTKTVADLVQSVREGRGALLMSLDGVPIEQAASAGGTDLEAIAGEYAGLLHQAQALSAELDCGVPLRFSVRGSKRRIVFAFVPGEMVLGVEAGPTSLRGQMQHVVAQATGQLHEL